MTEFVSKRRRDSLNSFASAVWGNAQAVLKRDHTAGVDYIDLTGHNDAFEFLLGSAVQHVKILVRDEYRTALHELETNNTYCRGAYVTGQPGIGKTLFLAYVLVARLGQQRTVAWELTTGSPFYVLFGDTATFYSLADTTPLDEYGPLWALSDSNDRVRSPGGIFYGLPTRVRTIQTTSPKESRWKEWSKQAGAECYVMDIWSEKEIADLAKLLNLDVERMTTLAKEWGGVPRSLLRFVRQHLTDSQIESMYIGPASKAVRKCQEMLSSLEGNALPDDTLSQFYFCRPQNNAEPGMHRRLLGASVPTRTLRRLLGEALQKQNNFVRLDFFRALSQPDSTRQATGYIYESWFHSYFSAGKRIECHWVQGLDGVSSLTGMNPIDTNWGAVNVEKPPYYWVAPKNFHGVDSALILAEEIYVFQVTISTRHKSPMEGLETLRAHLPANLKKIPWRAWRVVFVGDNDSAIETVANKWVGKLFATDNTSVTIGWSEVDPVMRGITYRVFRDESDPDVEESDEASMEVVSE